MQFGTLTLDDALGAILAHSLPLPGGVLKKGRVLAAGDLQRLRAAGLDTVVAAKLDASDVAEDEAARQLAVALGGADVSIAAPFTGRANLFAARAGILQFDPAALTALNLTDERVTVACLDAGERVDAGQMIATVKLIPFAVPADVLAAGVDAANTARISIAAFKPHRVGLVLTALAGTKPSVLAKREQVIAARVASAGSRIAASRTVGHDAASISAALTALANDGCAPLLVFAASAIVDRLDVVPAALVAAGGVIERLGMPVDPGNLLLLGSLGATPVIGIPSCAASPKLNGFDWVLERVLAAVPITTRDIAAMGHGGLLKEIASRPQPRDGSAVTAEDTERRAPRIACVVLAGGRSTRMGTNKLLEVFRGQPIVRHVVEAARASRAAHVRVVVGHQADAVARALDGLEVEIVINPDFAAGISSSVKAGLRDLPPELDGAMMALGDMPELSAAHFDRLIAAFDPQDNRSIIVPTFHGKRGNPVLWSSRYFAEMQDVSGDTGAKHLLGAYADQVVEVDLATEAVITDVDTPEALAALRARDAAD